MTMHAFRRVMNSEDTDVIFVPLSLSFSFINPRHSYPPLRCLSSMPVQHIMRSYSDSHLFLKLTAASGTVGGNGGCAIGVGEDEDRTSWYSGGELWDMDYVQHWLRLDETRTAIQQRMEYDAAELENWTMDDSGTGTGWKKMSSMDGKQQSLPCIEEDDTTLSKAGCKAGDEESLGSTRDMSWHHFHNQHLHHHHPLNHGHNQNHLQHQPEHHNHHHHHHNHNHHHHHPLQQLPSYGSGGSPGGDSWSSVDEYAAAETPPSKRSSMSCSDSIELLPPPGPIAGTDFTRDFYRLVKFESSKSLASTSSRSITGGCEHLRTPAVEAQLDREQALQSVLDFIAEQQQYCLSRQAEDKREPPVPQVISPTATTVAPCTASAVDFVATVIANGPSLPIHALQQTCDSNSCSDNQLLNSKDSGLCGSDMEIECLPEDYYADQQNVLHSPTMQTATSTPRSTLLRTVPEEDEESSAKSTSPQPPSSIGAGGSSSVCTADTAVMVNWPAATSSKDLIDQLNRMAVDDLTGAAACDVCTSPVVVPRRSSSSSSSSSALQTDLDEACCCPTGWVHVERDIDFADPKVSNAKIIMFVEFIFSGCTKNI